MPNCSCFIVECSCEESEDCISEAERLWTIGEKLIVKGLVGKITCRKSSITAKIHFLFLNELNNELIVKLCDEIQEEAQVFRFISIITKNVFYRYSPQRELLSSPEDYKKHEARKRKYKLHSEHTMCG